MRRTIASGWGPFALLLFVGVGVRLVLAVRSNPYQFDTQSWLIVGSALHDDPLRAYDTLRWPYPPGFFAWIFISTSTTLHQVVSFEVLVRLPMIAADVALALLVQDHLRRHGGTRTARLFATGVVALGPIFLVVSGYHGQIDAVGILPAVAAVWIWERDGPRRALAAGLLLGLGASIKIVPAFVVIALLPWARSRRERVHLLAPIVLMPAAMLVPFLWVNGRNTLEAITSNSGVGGFNGPTLLLYLPRLRGLWSALGIDPVGGVRFLTDIQQPLVAVGVVVSAFVLWRRRLPPASGAALIWLGVFACNPNPTWHYLVWGLPFFIMAGRSREVALFQVISILPLALFYQPDGVGVTVLELVYAPSALLLWLALIVAWVWGVRGALRSPAWSHASDRSSTARRSGTSTPPH